MDLMLVYVLLYNLYLCSQTRIKIAEVNPAIFAILQVRKKEHKVSNLAGITQQSKNLNLKERLTAH